MPDEARRTRKARLVLTATMLGIDSHYEPITQAVYQHREANVYPYLQTKGFAVTKLQGPLAKRHYVAPEAKKPEVEYLCGVGHGRHDTYTGDYGDIIFQVGNYHPDEVRGKIVHFLSCKTAIELGPDLVANGALAFFGYDEDFVFYPADKDAFLECDSEIDRAFADGLSASQVHDRVKKLFDQQIATFRATGKVIEAATLEFNRDHLRCPSSGGPRWGDEKAKLA